VRVLVTGGAGYIGSHTCVMLLQAGYDVIVVDNLSNSKEVSLERVQKIAGKELTFYKVDLLDRPALEKIFSSHVIEAVIHFAGLKAVGESVQIPLRYYQNNLTGTLVLCESMSQYNVKKLVFSSSATVYGNPKSVPIPESAPIRPTNPYGRTKAMLEDILHDLQISDPAWDIAILRYFNPIGAHPSGLIGEDPNGIPNNLLPYIAQVAIGKLPYVSVFGADYPTPDGTGVRDFIHVADLAHGHLKALEKLHSHPGVVTYNLGTGAGYSVFQVITAFEKACGKKIPHRIAPRRPGDAATSFADPSLARSELHWSADLGIDEMCVDIWRWQSHNPNGY
jgi:UDP-glucose 4-epimerase